MLKSKLFRVIFTIAICIVTATAIIIFAYKLHHHLSSTSQLAEHIYIGMPYEQVVEHLGEPLWLKPGYLTTGNITHCARFDLDNGQSLLVYFPGEYSEDHASSSVCGIYYRPTSYFEEAYNGSYYDD